MPFGKDGKFTINPHQNKMRDDAMAKGGKHAGGEEEHIKEGPAHSHHIHKTPQGFHSHTHHHDGSVSAADHASYDEAAQHGKEAMYDDGSQQQELEPQVGAEAEGMGGGEEGGY